MCTNSGRVAPSLADLLSGQQDFRSACERYPKICANNSEGILSHVAGLEVSCVKECAMVDEFGSGGFSKDRGQKLLFANHRMQGMIAQVGFQVSTFG